MKKAAIRAFASLSLALALTTLGGTAQAAVVNYSFSGTIDTAGPLLNKSFSGNFSYDNAQTPVPGFGSEELFDLASFTFSFDGATFGLSDLDYGSAVVDAGQFTGLDAGSILFSFLPASVPFAASFAFDSGHGDVGNGSVTYEIRDPNPNSVPEPATGALLAAGLLAAAALSKSRTR